jgi:hypothetical protein
MRQLPAQKFISGGFVRMLRLFAVFSLLGVLLCLSVTGFSQAGSGQIRGVCQDPEGVAIPGANITIKNVDTGSERILRSDDAGRFSAPFLPVGSYEFRAESAGMAPLVRGGLVLTVGATAEVVLDMFPDNRRESATGEDPMVLTTQTEMSRTLNDLAIQNLPVNGRRWENFVLLTPAVTNDGTAGLVSFRGVPGVFNNIMVDGADNNQAFFGDERGRTGIPYPISQETIREFQVETSNFSSEFGRATGGIVNAVTRSGTNQFHGSAFYYLRDKSFLAVDPFARAQGQPKPPERRHQFGASAGGPISTDRIFFFGSYDQQNRNFPVTVLPDGGDQFYTGSTAPAAATEQAVSFLRGLTGVFPRKANQYLGYGKVDWQVSDNHRLTSSLNILNFRSPNGVRTANVVNAPVSSNGFDGVKNETNINTLTSVLSPSTVNEFRFQYSRDFDFQRPNAPGPSVLISNAGGSFQFGMPEFLPRPAFPNEKRFQFADNLSFMRGAHDFKAGIDINAVRDLFMNVAGGGGLYSYSSLTAFVQDFAGLDTGASTRRHYNQFTQTFDSSDPQGRSRVNTVDYNFYFQDSYRISPRLTMNMGVRYEYQRIPQPTDPNPLIPETARLNNDKSNFAPRFGIAWQPMPRTMFRLGYGLSYGRTQNSTISRFLVNDGQTQWIYQQLPTGLEAPAFPGVFAAPPTAVVPVTVNLAARDFVNPEAHQGSVAVERQIGQFLSVSATYLTSRGTHLPFTRDTNITPATSSRSYAVLDAAGAVERTIAVPFYDTRPNRALGPLLTYETGASSWYNALVLETSKRFSHGIQFMSSFTWSHATDDGQSTYHFLPNSTVLDPFNRRDDYGNSDLDQRKRFVFSGYWQPRVDPNNWTAGFLFVDWKFSGIVTLADGFPQTGFVQLSPQPGALGSGLNGSNNTNGRFPGLGRNTFTRPGLSNVDLRVAREIKFRESNSVELLIEGFNVFNRVNYAAVNATQYILQGASLVPNTLFLKPQQALSNPAIGSPRQLQLALRFNF